MSYKCAIHHYREAIDKCQHCHRSICSICRQYGGSIDDKYACPSCTLAAFESAIPQWQGEKDKKVISLVITLILVVPGIVLSLATQQFAIAFILCGLAGLPTVLGKGRHKEMLGGNSSDNVLADIVGIGLQLVICFFFGLIVAPINVIRFSVRIASLSDKINKGNAQVSELQQLLVDANSENINKANAERRETEARAREQQRQNEERQAERQKVEEDRKKADADRRQRAIPPPLPGQKSYIVSLIDAGPYRQDVVDELKKLTGQQVDSLESGMLLAKKTAPDEAESIKTALQALGAQVEIKQSI